MVNAIRTTLLLALMTALFMVVGFAVAGRGGMVIALGIAVATNLFALWNSDKLVLRIQRARQIGPGEAPELFQTAATLAERAGIPMPVLYLIDSAQPNAFATGRDPHHAAIAVSSGLLRMLTPREVAAVVSHEMGHIRSRDTLVMSITATLAGAISMLAQFGLFFGSRSSNSPLGPIGSLLAIIVAPVAAALVHMAVSRTREYAADRDGAEISRDPLALASALEKISTAGRSFENPWARRFPGMAHLFIVNPLSGRGADSLFSTHPDVGNRIAVLTQIAKGMGAADPVVGGGGRQRVRPQRRRRAAVSSSGWRVPVTGRPPSPRYDLRSRGPWG